MKVKQKNYVECETLNVQQCTVYNNSHVLSRF